MILPRDIYLMISRHCHWKTLAHLQRVNKYWHTMLESADFYLLFSRLHYGSAVATKSELLVLAYNKGDYLPAKRCPNPAAGALHALNNQSRYLLYFLEQVSSRQPEFWFQIGYQCKRKKLLAVVSGIIERSKDYGPILSQLVNGCIERDDSVAALNEILPHLKHEPWMLLSMYHAVTCRNYAASQQIRMAMKAKRSASVFDAMKESMRTMVKMMWHGYSVFVSFLGAVVVYCVHRY
jgi:hypothetical protein